MQRFFWNVVALIALVVIIVGVVFSSSANALRRDTVPDKPAAPPDHSAPVSMSQ